MSIFLGVKFILHPTTVNYGCWHIAPMSGLDDGSDVDDLSAVIRADIVAARPCVSDAEMIHALTLRGFGYRDNDAGGDLAARLFLESFEALYLVHTGRLELYYRGRQLTFDSFLGMCRKTDSDVLTRFLIYRDLRTRGYVAKDGFGFGADFRVYERGQFGQKGSSLLVFGLVEGQPEKMGRLQRKIREITQMGKEPIMAVVDRHGEIIYYKINTNTFHENKYEIHVPS